MVFDHPVLDRWSEPWMSRNDSVAVGKLLDRLERQPAADVWKALDRLFIVEAECWYREGFTALPALARIAQSGAESDRHRAIDLAAAIVRTCTEITCTMTWSGRMQRL